MMHRRVPRIAVATAAVFISLCPGLAAAALAASAPSMIADGNNVNITVAGESNRLLFFWAVSGSPTWNPEQVAPPGTLKQSLVAHPQPTP